MPTLLPPRARADKKSTKESGAGFMTDCVGIWSISLGIAAATFAMFVYFGDADQVAATFILCAAAALIQLATCVYSQNSACD